MHKPTKHVEFNVTVINSSYWLMHGHHEKIFLVIRIKTKNPYAEDFANSYTRQHHYSHLEVTSVTINSHLLIIVQGYSSL